METKWKDTEWGPKKSVGGTCPSATLTATRFTRADLESNPNLREAGDEPPSFYAVHRAPVTMSTPVQLYMQMFKSVHILPLTNDAVTLNTVLQIWWAHPGGNAIPGQHVTVVKQVPSTP